MGKFQSFFGVLIKDLLRYLWFILSSKTAYLKIGNRHDRFIQAPTGFGLSCDWRWTSNLHAPTVLPILGKFILQKALQDHPILLFQNKNVGFDRPNSDPAITFIIGHRGRERLPQLLTTIASISGQQDISFECIVIEQSLAPEIKSHLPGWVTYIHTAIPDASMPYSRSWAFNVGAKHANGSLLVFHDNDILVPSDYAFHAVSFFEKGYQLINLKRFIFYMDQQSSMQIQESRSSRLQALTPSSIMQNAEGGGSIAIGRNEFFSIGGFDETFVGWGGEDNEFWERARILEVWEYGFLSFVHLWHPVQTEKSSHHGNPSNSELYQKLSAIDPEERIKKLRSRPIGVLSGPTNGSI